MKIEEILIEQYDIPRNKMPQIHLDNVEKTHTTRQGSISIDRIKPAQSQRVPGLAKTTAENIKNGFDKPIMVDKDGYIVNGHHRYDAYKMLNAEKVPVIIVTDSTLADLIDEFSHTTKDVHVEDITQDNLDQVEKNDR